MNSKPFSPRPSTLLHPNYRGSIFKEPLTIIRQRNLILNEIAVDMAVMGKYAEAVTLLNKVVEEEVRSQSGTHSLGFHINCRILTLCVLIGNHQRHMLSRPELKKKKPDIDSRFLLNRGDCHRALGNSDLALSDYHRALNVQPDSWEVSMDVAQVVISLAWDGR